MANMAKELEELKKGKHRGTRKNPLGEMNASFSRRIREAELPPKFKMPAEKYSGLEDPGATWRVLALEQVDIDEQLQVKVEHDEARSTKRPKKGSPKPVAVKKFQNHPPNPSTYRPPPSSQHRDRYPVRRTPPRTTPPLREVAWVASEEDWYNHYTSLNASQETIYLAIRDNGLLKKPVLIKIPTNQRNRYKYCDFHEDVGHNTSECYSLCNQIEGLVKGGLLVKFLPQVRDSIKVGNEVQLEMRDVEERRKVGGKDLMQ
ncbi:hypothetical protein LWI29_026659 [Acer saccharum]|uniref:Reverse transcriptase domain-containing protein n=1 Tax=Acer saccharum TaxID=4024 RepID=A0AA39W332_ACESA|nr:hypothetical protein LWI29_026659 [Acer saccharum]